MVGHPLGQGVAVQEKGALPGLAGGALVVPSSVDVLLDLHGCGKVINAAPTRYRFLLRDGWPSAGWFCSEVQQVRQRRLRASYHFPLRSTNSARFSTPDGPLNERRSRR